MECIERSMSGISHHIKFVIEPYLFPLIGYHERWSSLADSDFNVLKYNVKSYERGYDFYANRYLDSAGYDALALPSYYCEEDTKPEELSPESLFYLKKMMDFCEDHGIALVLIKTPHVSEWNNAAHNAVSEIAEEYELPFLDFNYAPYIFDINYNNALDSKDGAHLNYEGAVKFTRFLSTYLTNNYNLNDIRNDNKYIFMEEQKEAYLNRNAAVAELVNCSDVASYLTDVNAREDAVVFLTVKGDVGSSLSEEFRQKLTAMGLNGLVGLQKGDAYIGAFENGNLLFEKTQSAEKWRQKEQQESDEKIARNAAFAAGEETVSLNDLSASKWTPDIKTELQEEAEQETKEKGPLTFGGILENNSFYTVESGGAYFGNSASCMLNDVEEVPGGDGINVIVYDKKADEVIDKVCFPIATAFATYRGDISAELEKRLAEGVDYTQLPADMQKLYLYNKRCEASLYAKDLRNTANMENVGEFVGAYRDKEDTDILICAGGHAAKVLDEDVKTRLGAEGLWGAVTLQNGDSYIALFRNGTLMYEERSSEGLLTLDGINYEMKSDGSAEEPICSVMVKGTEQVSEKEGIYVVIYDTAIKAVVDKLFVAIPQEQEE